jgi:phage regulator Rha-like protein
MENDLMLVQNLIYEIRGHRVMLDSDLARLYEIETKSLNRAVKRNIDRFPDFFMFQLTKEEWEVLRCQFGSLKNDIRKYRPYVFTEHGILMLSSVLNSKRAIQINIQIMVAFVELRHYALEQSLKDARNEDLQKMLLLHIENTDNKFSEQDKTINQIIQVLNNLIDQPKPKKQIGFTSDDN